MFWLVGEVSDDIVNIDNALRWGFGWEKDLLNYGICRFESVINKMKEDNLKISDWVLKMYEKGYKSFYKFENKNQLHYCNNNHDYIKLIYLKIELHSLNLGSNKVIKKGFCIND